MTRQEFELAYDNGYKVGYAAGLAEKGIEPRENGEWLDNGNTWKCSECGIIRAKGMTGKYNFCPSCGAEMKGGKE